MTVYTLVALLYLMLSLPLVYGLRRLERRLGSGKAR
jgi:polar amino acid transport system permease protein